MHLSYFIPLKVKGNKQPLWTAIHFGDSEVNTSVEFVGETFWKGFCQSQVLSL